MMGYLSKLSGALLALRAGERTFADVSREARPLLARRAGMLTRRWRASQELQDEEDLIQVMLLALWRAVDSWDPSRCADVTRYVDVSVQRAARESLRKAAGYPDARRSPILRRAHVEEIELTVGGEEGEQEVADLVRTLLDRLPGSGPNAVIRVTAELMVSGCSPEEAARKIYQDPRQRLRFRLDSEHHALMVTRAAADMVRGAATELFVREDEGYEARSFLAHREWSARLSA